MNSSRSHEHEGVVAYALVEDIETRFRAQMGAIIDAGAKRFCDVGGGSNPIVPVGRIRDCGLDYLVLDESQEQLSKTREEYGRVRASILDADALSALVRERGAFDAVISRWTAEHIPDGKAFHERVFELLRPGGTALHMFPTLYSLPFVINRVLTPGVSAALLFSTSGRTSKFRPFYSWCRGPSERQIRRLESVGYSVESYTGFFGHSFYAPVKPVHAAHRRAVQMLLQHPLPSMTSFALVVLKRPL